MRINKYLALGRFGSRRGVEDIITAGRVKVNGAVVTNLATDISETDIVSVDGKPVQTQTEKVYIMLHKPVGAVTTAADPEGRRTVLDVVYENPKQYRALLDSVRLFPVGRLDYGTSGLLLLTNDGDLANKLVHPSTETPKTYIAAADRVITDAELATLSAGVVIREKPIEETAKGRGRGNASPKFRQKPAYKTAPAIFEYNDRKPNTKHIVRITIHEGRNRQIRKMFETIGVELKSLQRIAEGRLTLGNLKPGDWRFVRKNEII